MVREAVCLSVNVPNCDGCDIFAGVADPNPPRRGTTAREETMRCSPKEVLSEENNEKMKVLNIFSENPQKENHVD